MPLPAAYKVLGKVAGSESLRLAAGNGVGSWGRGETQAHRGPRLSSGLWPPKSTLETQKSTVSQNPTSAGALTAWGSKEQDAQDTDKSQATPGQKPRKGRRAGESRRLSEEEPWRTVQSQGPVSA